MKRSVLLSTLAALACTTPALAAGETPKPLAALQACRALADAAARLACYDKAADALVASAASGDTVVVERSEVRKVRKGLFGFTMPKIAFLTGRPGNAQDSADEEELATTITAARSIGYGKFRFTVENGAVWETVEASTMADDPRAGASVVIKKGLLGAYYAKVGAGRRVQAKRVG